MARFLHSALHQTQIVLVNRPVLQNGRHGLKAGHGLANDQQAAGVAVQAIADRGMKSPVVLLCQLALLPQIGQSPFHRRHILRRSLLREKAGRLVKENNIPVLVDDPFRKKAGQTGGSILIDRLGQPSFGIRAPFACLAAGQLLRQTAPPKLCQRLFR